jgi:hypothetical protein
MKMMILALQPHMHQEEILLGDLSGDMKEQQLQAIVAVGRKKYPQKPCKLCATHKNVNTPDISATHAEVPPHKGE